MSKHGKNDGQPRKVADLTVEEFEAILLKCLEKIAFSKHSEPPTESDENKFLTTKQAADFLRLSRQTVQEKKKRKLIKFYGEGRIQRTTVAECKKFLAEFGIPLASIKRAEKEAEEKRKKEEAEKKRKEEAAKKKVEEEKRKREEERKKRERDSE